jgi:alkanesulfonate monooxygenase
MIKLGVILDSGSHVAAWRHRDVPADAAWSFPHHLNLAQIAERGLFDMVFFADSLATRSMENPEIASLAEPAKHLEPMLLLAGIAASTKHIGLVSTATTTYYEPYHLARFFATLDHMSNGRAGWNLVTSQNANEAGNFGRSEHPTRDVRYARARDFVRVVQGLWDSWTDDAFLYDKEQGRYFDPGKMQILRHRSDHFNVAGPLNVPRSPQGWPVITQAGSSLEGMALGAETSDVIFTAQLELEDAVQFAADVRRRALGFGRNINSIKIMPGIVPFVGRTRQEAMEKRAALDVLIGPELGLSVLSALIGNVDLSGYDLDGPLPDLTPSNTSQSRQALFIAAAKRDGLTIRQLYQRACCANGHRVVTGTAHDIADDLTAWFEAGAADGFVLIPASLPGGLEDFVNQVVPELQRRGLFRTAYDGVTLRENLGLPRPLGQQRGSV